MPMPSLKLDFFTKLPFKQKALLVSVLALFILAGYWYFYLDSKISEFKKTSTELDNLRKDVEKSRVAEKQLPILKARAERSKKELEEALKLLPLDKEIPKLLTDISDAAKISFLDVKSFKQRGEKLDANFANIPLELKFTGSYHNVLSFFDKLARFERIVTVSNVVMGEPKPEGEVARITVTCLATTYRYIEGKQPDEKGKDKGKK